jgi:hypothetical protein
MEIISKIRNLTNTFKLTHRNEQNTSKTSYSSGKEFHTPPALSLPNFIYDRKEGSKIMFDFLKKTTGN